MLFNSPNGLDYNFDEGTVTQVDVYRKVCVVRTLKGKVLNSVQWLSPSGGSDREGDRFSPQIGNRVVITHSLGYPVILGFLPKIQDAGGSAPVNIQGSNSVVDTGDYTAESGSILPDSNSPSDMVIGDRVFTSRGGGQILLALSGSILLRASQLSQVFLDKARGLVKVVSRLWEHFTDVSSDVVYNLNSRVYRYTGYTYTFNNSKVENYQLHFMYGDVQAADTIKTSYASVTSAPAFSNVVYKEKITGSGESSGTELMHRTLSLDGSEEVYVTNGSSFTRMNASNNQLTFSFGDQHTITVNGSQIKVHRGDGADITMDSNGIRATFNNGNINWSSSSLTLTYSGGTTTMTSSGITTTYGGHYITVDASGVGLG